MGENALRRGALALGALAAGWLAAALPVAGLAAGESRFSDEPIPPRLQDVPQRPRPLIELGDPFLGTGEISPGITLPTGAVWRPSFIAYGTVRSSLQTFDPGTVRRSEWANRIDLFGNLQLSGTERILIGLRPVDQDGNFSGYVFEPDGADGTVDATNGNITTLFFEGDFSQLFPKLDPEDRHRTDWGFSIGRQPFLVQDGLLINESALDAAGLVRANIYALGVEQARLTALIAIDDVDRGNGANAIDRDAELYGLFWEADYAFNTVNVDFAYVDSLDDAIAVGVSSTQTFGRALNTTLSVLYSDTFGVRNARQNDGWVVFGQANWTPLRSHNLVYATAFVGIDHFRSAARAPGTGGPLGRAGILFAGVGIGRFGAALANQTDEAFGGVIGYQMFFSQFRRQLILEFGGREEYKGPDSGAYAFGVRYQQAIGQRWKLQLNGFVGDREATGFMNGAGIELLYQM